MEMGEIVSLCMSTGTALATFYFWLVRSRKERPNLKTHLVAPFDAFIGEPARAYRLRKFEKWAFKSDPWNSPDHESFFYYILAKAVVANYSVEPNTVTGARAWLKSRDGTWQPLHTAFIPCPADAVPPPEFDSTVPVSGDASRLLDIQPFNVPPQNGVFLRLACWLTVPEGSSAFERKRLSKEEFSRQLDQFVTSGIAQPLELKVELAALGGKVFSDVLTEQSAEAVGPRFRMRAVSLPPLPAIPEPSAPQREEVLAGVKSFLEKTALPDGSFRPRLQRDTEGSYDCADSNLAAVAYAAVLSRLFGWPPPHPDQTRDWLLARQQADGSFVAVPGLEVRPSSQLQVGDRVLCRWKGGAKEYPGVIAEREADQIQVRYDDGDTEWTTAEMMRPSVGGEADRQVTPQARVFNTILGQMALHALGVKPPHDPVPVFAEVMKGAYRDLPEYYSCFFPLAYRLCGRPFPEEEDRKWRQLLAEKVFAREGLGEGQLEACRAAVCYHRLLGQPIPHGDRILSYVLRGFRPADYGWINNERGGAHGMFAGVFILRQMGKGRSDCQRVIAEAAQLLLLDWRKTSGDGRYWQHPNPDADDIFYSTAALVMAGILRPTEPLPAEAHLLGWGLLLPPA